MKIILLYSIRSVEQLRDLNDLERDISYDVNNNNRLISVTKCVWDDKQNVKEVRKETKLKFYELMSNPTLLYRSETQLKKNKKMLRKFKQRN